MIEENVEVVVLDLEAREHERVPKSSTRVGVPPRDIRVMLHWFLPSTRLLIV